MAPITPFPRFDYFDPGLGMTAAVVSLHNLSTAVHELILPSPFVLLA